MMMVSREETSEDGEAGAASSAGRPVCRFSRLTADRFLIQISGFAAPQFTKSALMNDGMCINVSGRDHGAAAKMNREQEVGTGSSGARHLIQ